MEVSGVVKGTNDSILVAIQISMVNVQSEIWPLLYKLRADFDEIFKIALQWYMEQFIRFLGRSGC